MDTAKRSLLKTMTWYASHLIMATSVAFIITGSVRMAATIASLEIVWESALFFTHERAWAKFGHKVK
jgi:uncharacterized membrane protein